MKASKSIGILREVKNKWERRVPITPSEVRKLVDRKIRVLIQPCERRVFKDMDFQNAGGIITEDLSSCSFIVGVKDIPSSNLFEYHSYLNFAHVIKGQASNMPFLDECLAKKIRLFDYECIRDPQTKLRTVAFGRFAGVAGMITGMRGLGEHLLAQGCATPFLNLSSCYMYSSLEDARQQVLKIGHHIAHYGLPCAQYGGAFVFCFTGEGGNVTNGAIEIFKLLPHEFVDAKDLSQLQNKYSPNKVYGCVLKTQDIVNHVGDGAHFEESHYFDYPEEYVPVFASNVAPYTRVLVNGMYWDHRYPRLLSNAQMQSLGPQLLAVFDISCDPEGAVEFLKKTTSTDAPYFTYKIEMDEAVDHVDGDGVLVLAVDSLPAELPLDSSQYFSATLYPYLEQLATSDSDVDIAQQQQHLGAQMFNAMITYDGELTQNFHYIDALRRERKNQQETDGTAAQVLRIDGHLFDSGLINQILDLIESHDAQYNILELQSKVNTPQLQRASRLIVQIDAVETDHLITKLKTMCELNPKAHATLIHLPFGASKRMQKVEPNKRRNESKNVLILGSGRMVQPVIDYLCDSGNNWITIATNDVSGAAAIANNKYCDVIEWDAHDAAASIVSSSHDIVISLLPAAMHTPIARACIKHGIHMVTASYISDEMRSLDASARDANVILLNECGLDPGLDHMSATQMIREAHTNGESITAFHSLCGGLPSPESANNAFGYKFSWSPSGVLSASASDAQYLANGELVRIAGDRLLVDGRAEAVSDNPYPSLALQHVANRDSLQYISKYELNADPLVDMYRGTLRYEGFTDCMFACRALGLCDDPLPAVTHSIPWSHYLRKVIVNKYGTNDQMNTQQLIASILAQNNIKSNKINSFLQCLEDDFNLFDDATRVSMNGDPFCDLLSDKLRFKNGERDIVIMINKIKTNQNKIYESSLLVRGDEQYSAMARTVGIPVAIATQFLLNQNDAPCGVIDATNNLIAQTVLDEAKQYGIEFQKRIINQI
eukprot:165725_1